MTKETRILQLKARRTVLLARDRENRNIVKKIERQLRALEAA